MPQLLCFPERSQLLFLLICGSTRRGPASLRYALKEFVQVSTSALARKVSIVRWSSIRDGFCGTSEHVGDRMSESLEPVCLEPDFIVNDVIVGRTNCALETVVRLKEEIEVCASFRSVDVDLFECTLTINCSDTPIHNGSWPRVSISISELGVGREEACVVPFSADDDRQFRSIRLFGISKGCECFDNIWKLFINDCIELPLRDTVAVDDDSAWQRLLLLLIERQPFFHHGLQIGYHLVDYQPHSTLN